jgi:cellulose synthase/poly-beta-1,6-N-acetylglucosamine synthase-like glycosyltransferase
MTVCMVMPAHDEAPVLEWALEGLARVRGGGVSVVLVSDGSTDATASVMKAWAAERPNWTVVTLEGRVGKGEALNAGIAAGPASDLTVTCDADVRLDPDCLADLSRCFSDPRVGAASGLLWPVNAHESIVTRYCALELWQHQLITSAAKQRLGLNPPAHGWLSCYRREALAQIGGFAATSLGEDVEASNALVRAGWQTRFVMSARAFGEVPRTLGDYWHQHVRWSRGLHDAAPPTGAAEGVSWMAALELWFHAAGYLDRPLLIVGAGLAVLGFLSPLIPLGYACLLAAEALCALGQAGHMRDGGRFLAAAGVMVTADLAASMSGSIQQLGRRRRRWQRSTRDPRAITSSGPTKPSGPTVPGRGADRRAGTRPSE